MTMRLNWTGWKSVQCNKDFSTSATEPSIRPSAHFCWRRQRRDSCASPSRRDRRGPRRPGDQDRITNSSSAGNARRRGRPTPRVLRRTPGRRGFPDWLSIIVCPRVSASRCSDTCRRVRAATTYKQLAQRVGNPAAFELSDGLCHSTRCRGGSCHRVLRADGTLGGYLSSWRSSRPCSRSKVPRDLADHDCSRAYGLGWGNHAFSQWASPSSDWGPRAFTTPASKLCPLSHRLRVNRIAIRCAGAQ